MRKSFRVKSEMGYTTKMHVTEYQGLQLSYPAQLEFDTLIEEPFKNHGYYVDLDTQTPLIIDAGAHIGVSALYFHKMYPKATLVCIEPNPTNLPFLFTNLEDNFVENVTIIPKALVGEKGKPTVTLYTHPQWGVFSSLKANGWSEDHKMNPIEVETIKLSEILTKPVDLLKMDIEGVETEVLREAQQKLHFVKHLILEFHETEKDPVEYMQKFLSSFFKDITVTKDLRTEKNRRHQLYLIEASKAS